MDIACQRVHEPYLNLSNMASATELTKQFYEWERRGRGWDIAQYPVDLEPPFHPFFGHYIPMPYTDDGKRPTLLSRVAELFQISPARTHDEYSNEKKDTPYPYTSTDALERLSILLSKNHIPSPSRMEQLLVVLSYCEHPISFEIVADATIIELQIVCRESETYFVEQQVRTYVRDCVIVNTTDKGENLVSIDERPSCLIDFGLHEEFMRPILTDQRNGESYGNVLTLCDSLKGDERIVVQVLFKGVVNVWAESIYVSVTDNADKSFFLDAPEMPKLAEQKNAAPLFGATLRLFVQSDNEDRSSELLKLAIVALKLGTKSPYNSIIPLPDERYTFDMRFDDFLNRQSHRTGMLLNAKELASFVYVPQAAWSKKFEHSDTKTKQLPNAAIGHAYVLGINEHFGHVTDATLSTEQRLKHLHIIGSSGTGKSTLLLSLIQQDMEQGNGIAVLDAHGDLIEAILAHVPTNRMKDVVLIDPSDSEYPIPFNVLKAHTAIEKEILSSDLVASFKRLSSSWGDQMNSVLANAILAFLNSSQGGTLIELRRFLIEKPFREAYLKTIEDEHILYYWQHEYPLLKSSSIGSILTRLDIFLRPTLIRNMVSQKDCIDMAALMDSKRIILVKLSHGIIGAENSYLLGTAIVSKMQQVAMSRQAQAKELRNNFFIYIDEFQHFINPSLHTILSGARKYHVGLVLAHQTMQQLQKQDGELAGEVIANAGTRICFRLGEYDARLFSTSFSSFTPDDLQRLNTGQAIARIERSDYDFSITTLPSTTPIQDADGIARIIDHSRKTYTARFVEQKDSVRKPEVSIQEPLQQPKAIQPESSQIETPVGLHEVQQLQSAQPLQDVLEQFAKRKETQRHRSTQLVIKKLAEAKGFVVTLEAPIPHGKVDVSLVKGSMRIACEVSISTDATWESHNITKCLEANYDQVWCIVSSAQTKASLETFVATLEPSLRRKVTVIEQVHMQSLFEQLPHEQTKPQEEVIKGYRVKLEFGDNSTADMKKKQQSLQNILKGGKRK